MTWRATVLTIFPEMLPGPLAYSLAGKALKAGLWRLETVDIRDFARDKHRSVDDAPFGGGPGMVMRPDVIDAALAGSGGVGPVLLMSPRGRRLDQQRVHEFAAMPGLTLVCGRFEGVDERLVDTLEAAADQRQPGHGRELVHPLLIEPAAAGRHQQDRPHTARSGERGIDDVGPHHHSRTAAKRRVVDGTMFIAREIADVYRFQPPQPRFQRLAGQRVGE